MRGQAEANAKRILVHYFRTAFEHIPTTRWDSDMTAEVEGIVEDIIEAVKDHLRKPAPAAPCQHEHVDRGPMGVSRCTDCGASVDKIDADLRDTLAQPAVQPCRTCRGAGTIEIDFSTHDYPNRKHRAPCAQCNGRGEAPR